MFIFTQYLCMHAVQVGRGIFSLNLMVITLESPLDYEPTLNPRKKY